MTNPLNHFSEIGKHVLAVEIKVYGFCVAFDSQNTTRKPLSLAKGKGDQVCDVRPKYSTVHRKKVDERISVLHASFDHAF